jgi:hypothetical protein
MVRDVFNCWLCGPQSLREGVDLSSLECHGGEGISRYAYDLYAKCDRCKAKMSIECLGRWRSKLLIVKKKILEPKGEDVIDPEEVWATLQKGPWECVECEEDHNWRPPSLEAPGTFKRSCVNCEESEVAARVRAIEPGFREAIPTVKLHEIQEPVVVDHRCNDDGTDGERLALQTDIVQTWPMVAADDCEEYFKAARDQPSTCPGLCALTLTHCSAVATVLVMALLLPSAQTHAFSFVALVPVLFHSKPEARDAAHDLRVRLIQAFHHPSGPPFRRASAPPSPLRSSRVDPSGHQMQQHSPAASSSCLTTTFTATSARSSPMPPPPPPSLRKCTATASARGATTRATKRRALHATLTDIRHVSHLNPFPSLHPRP